MVNFFFLVGPDYSSSEEVSTVEYSACALSEVYEEKLKMICFGVVVYESGW